MNLYPAIDLKNNKCVRLHKGEDNTSVVFNEDPVKQAIYFEKRGSKKIHIVDLDAAFGRKDVNTETIKNIRNAIKIPIQMGGGIRTANDAKILFDLKIDFLIIGSLSVTNFEEVSKLADLYKDKIYVSLDIKDKNIMIKGWEEKTNLNTKNIFNKFNTTNIRGYVLTDVERDGTLEGINIDLIESNISLTQKKLIAGGGIKSYEDLKKIKKIKNTNFEGIIVGKSFYIGNIDINKAQKLLEENA